MKDHPWLTILLTPFSWLYGLITFIRNGLYNAGFFPSQKTPQMVISVGNITVGGTGKSPVTEYLVRLILPVAPVAILSRGYGRETRGFLLANENVTAREVGDEPMQFYQKFKQLGVAVAVCEKRIAGAHQLADLFPETKLLVLDDAFQHRAIRRDINLLLNDYNRPIYEDLPFPAGRLRETRGGARRADAVIVTKCPAELPADVKYGIEKKIKRIAGDKPVFFSRTHYHAPLSYNGASATLKKVKIVAGIANPAPFERYTTRTFDVTDKAFFPDHYNYTIQDVREIIQNLKNDTFVLTTEKDMVKLKPLVEQMNLAERFAYIPVAVDFGEDTGRFENWIKTRIEGLAQRAE